ncbi:ABC transporter permease [Ohtaekwangia koreensis]|uniref:Duplicated orphan permease n=1 Tax=Ohtaekwangia koreensis TaxID=688867 RepID=A0A1T5MGP5_9BACT|nr:ABC transporter permease [Ohtaekwangia koreensis]SKC87078.1 duplicated orphan permease [Ohtaekwangia koreensis]
MLRHNLLLIYRNFKKFKSTFFINLIGLSTGLACTLLIYLWVKDELSVDKFLEKDSQLYQVQEHRVKSNGIWTSPTTSGPLAETLTSEMPEVEYSASVTRPDRITLSVDDTNLKTLGRSAGKNYFKIFSYRLIDGNRDNVLTDKNSIVISDALAIRLFNTTENLIGKPIELDNESKLFVTGIFKKMPLNASDQFDFVLSFEKFKEGRSFLETWNSTSVLTYILLKEGTDVKAFDQKIKDLVKVKTDNNVTHRTLFTKQYSKNYLYGKYENGVLTGGRITYVKLFSIIAIFILVIACINFMNLSTAKASRRIKEVGIKKAVGAARKTLIYQYLGESLLLSFLSLLLAILIVDIALPHFNIITGKYLALNFNPALILSCIGVSIFTGIAAGSYPALYLSGFNPATVLKGKINTAIGELWARKGLVVFQFALSVIFIVSVLVVYKQIEYVQSQNLGYNKDNVLYFPREGKMWQEEPLESFIAGIRAIPGVMSSSSISHTMTGHNSGTYGVVWEGKAEDDATEFENFTVNYDMMETLGIEMKEGRTFSKEFGADSSKIIFNEAAIEFMGLKDPIGKTVKLWGEEMQIIGVAKDFHFESLHEKVKPVFFRLEPGDTYLVMSKLAAGAEAETIGRIKDYYQKVNPGFIFEYKFLDNEYQAQYVAEQRVALLSRYFAGLAILISCLGLFGLAAFTAERRLKEIGIRKVLGSSEFGIVYLLSGDFTKMVILAICIACPVSYILLKFWLSDFAYKIDLTAWYFVGAGIMALLTAWITVGVQAIKAARVNPVKCLKDE